MQEGACVCLFTRAIINLKIERGAWNCAVLLEPLWNAQWKI